MTDRQEWEHATADTRLLAIAAHAELRRRHPSQRFEPLRSAEPALAEDIKRERSHLATDRKPAESAPRIRDQAMHRQAFRARMTERPQLMASDSDPIRDDLGKVFPGRHACGKAPILQPPKPEIIPSARILRLAAERETEPGYEAAD